MKVGDKIKIIYMEGEPQYAGAQGEIEHIGKDYEGKTYYRGTWGGCSVYPDVDKIELL